MNDTIQSILNKQVSRKEFLQHVGLALVAATGATAVVKNLQSHGSSAKPLASTYGASAYGGKRR